MKDEGGKSARDLRARSKDFALRIIRVYQALNKRDGVAQVLGRQMIRSGTSVAAHYREACRAKSNSDFVNKLEGRCKNSTKQLFGWSCFRNPVRSNHCEFRLSSKRWKSLSQSS